jgi:hypothetical protein
MTGFEFGQAPPLTLTQSTDGGNQHAARVSSCQGFALNPDAETAKCRRDVRARRMQCSQSASSQSDAYVLLAALHPTY